MNRESHDHLPTPGKLLGVVARTADMAGVDPTLLRIGALVMLCIAFKLTLALYCVTAIAFRLARA